MEKKSIRSTLNHLVIASLICVGVIVIAVSIPVIYSAIVSETEEGLKNLSHSLADKCELMGGGDYNIKNKILYKGVRPFGDGSRVVDRVKEVSGIDATIFWNDTRMLTTLELENGNRAIGTKAPSEVTDRVVKEGKDYFSSKVLVGGKHYYGYYVPLRNPDNTVVGMVFVGKDSELIIETMLHIILIVTSVVAMAIIAVLGIVLKYTGGIIDSLGKTKEFLRNVAQGEVDCELDEKVLRRQDEFGEMGRFARLLQKTIVKAVGTDPLTGLYNRRSCNEAVENALEEYKKHGKKCTIVIGDIDDFKRLNDTFGHLAGDQVLKAVSEILQINVHRKGIVARWGGEEFLLLYREENPLMHIEKLLEKIRNMEISYKGETIHITMTFGVCICKPEDTIESVIKRADEKLYQGKENGKNQVVV